MFSKKKGASWTYDTPSYYFSDISLIAKKRNYFTTTLRVEPSLMRMMLRPF